MSPRGRPRLVNFPCPECGENRLQCYSTKRQGSLRARYYVCAGCGHRGVLVEGASRSWWKDAQAATAAQMRQNCG